MLSWGEARRAGAKSKSMALNQWIAVVLQFPFGPVSKRERNWVWIWAWLIQHSHHRRHLRCQPLTCVFEILKYFCWPCLHIWAIDCTQLRTRVRVLVFFTIPISVGFGLNFARKFFAKHRTHSAENFYSICVRLVLALYWLARRW